jgi:hypothetical protein
MKPNLVVLTIGRCGSTVLTQMIGQLGWNLPDDADEYAEPGYVRDINERLIRNQPIDDEEFQAAMGLLESPWVLKDPRFCWTLKHWRDWFADAALIWLTRDLADVERSLRKQKWGRDTPKGYTLRGVTLPTIEKWCGTLFENWPGLKHKVSHEQIREAVRLFDLNR